MTYMPSRNTREQLIRLRENCERHAFFQISGEDINQPRQPFVCQAMRDPLFANLYDAAWALIGHEQLAGKSLDNGMFSAKTQRRQPDLNHRIRYYRAAAREILETMIRFGTIRPKEEEIPMLKPDTIRQAYAAAAETYAAYGIDTEAVLEQMKKSRFP